MMRLRILLVVAALVSCAGVARATDTYPEFIRSELGLATTPECTLCHLTNEGQENTVRRPFGLQVLSHDGKGGGSRGSIRSALQAMEGDGSDSDGDGLADIEELRAGGDPNVFEARDGGATEPPPGVALPPAFETGCAMSLAARVTISRTLVVIASLLAAVRLSRRRRERRAPGSPERWVKSGSESSSWEKET